MKCKILSVDGTIAFVENDKSHADLKFLQGAVRGYIEVVYLSNGWLMIVNEEGKINGLPVNDLATTIYQIHHGESDIIVGDVVWIHEKYMK